MLCFKALCHDFLSKIFCLTIPKHFVEDPSVLFFRKLLVEERLLDKREGEVSRFFFRKILSHRADKSRRGTIKCVTDFGYRKILGFSGFCHDIVSKIFCLTVPKYFVEDPSVLCFRKLLVEERFLDKREGEVSRFFFEKFCLTVPTKVVGEPLNVSLISGIEKF